MAPATPRKLFVNLPVGDLEKTKAFFGELGFEFNPQFTDENAACMVLSDDGYVMLLQRQFFVTFTTKEVCDATTQVEVLNALTATSREEVDRLVDKAVELGARDGGARDLGFMYQRSFADLDGHVWEIFWMDETTIEGR